MENQQKRWKNEEKWIVSKNVEIVAILKSWKIIKSDANFGSIFHNFDICSSISINQSQILMKKSTKSSKNVAGKKSWFYRKEMFNYFADWKSNI